MRKGQVCLWILGSALFAVIVVGGFRDLSSTAYAQGNILAARIYGVDLTRFPTVTVSLQVINLNDGVPVSEKPQVVSIVEDGQELPAKEAAIQSVEMGADIVILLDASQSIVSPASRGYTGKSRLDEARDVVRSIASSKGSKSRLALLAPVGPDLVFIGLSAREGNPLTENGNLIANALEEMNFPPRPRGQEATPLFDLLGRALETLYQAPGRSMRPGMIIVLSDGIDFLSDQQVVDVTTRAREKQIIVHAIQIGPAMGKGSERAMENLRRIAAQTGGQVWIYQGENIKPFYESLRAWERVALIQYRSRVRESAQHQIRIRLNVGGQMLETGTQYALTIRPPAVQIEWEGGEEIDAGEIMSLPVIIRIEWTDQRDAYRVKAMSIRVGEALVPFVQEGDPQWEGSRVTLRGTVDLAGSPEGAYALQVDVEDDLGLRAQSRGPLIRRPAAPPPPVTRRGLQDVLPFLSCGIALAALMVAVFAFARSPRLREAAATMTQPIVQRIKEVTEPFFPGGAARSSEPVRAWLVVVEGESEQRQIPIRSTHVRLGRDETLVNIVFSDRSVSRLHCRIEEVEAGVFMIYDEGSTSGTYVNYEQVPINGMRLQDGDLINLGRVQLQFRLKLEGLERRAPESETPLPKEPSVGDDQTRPFEKVEDEKTRVFQEDQNQ